MILYWEGAPVMRCVCVENGDIVFCSHVSLRNAPEAFSSSLWVSSVSGMQPWK